MHRRDFVRNTFAAAAGASSGATLATGQEPRNQESITPQPGRTLRAGVIGTGWYGMVNCRHLIREGGAQVEVVSLCDPDADHVRNAAGEVQRMSAGNRRPETFRDFREMLRPRNLDVVIVGSPDHWHALHAIAAIEAGADVYVEKPVAHTYFEGVAMLNAARRHNRVVQVGTQRRSTPHIAQAREFVRAGNLGRIGFVRAFCYYSMRGNENTPDSDPPSNLDFDLWLGPAPQRRYNRLYHPRTWRKFNEFSNGILGDMGIHMLDVVRWFMDLRWPRTITSTGGIHVLRGGRPNTTDTQTVSFGYGDTTVVWEHRAYGPSDEPGVGWGINFFGDRGQLQVTLDHWEFRPHGPGRRRRESAQTSPSPDVNLEPTNIVPAGRAHWRNFLECVRSRQRPIADIEEGFVSTSICLLGNVSQQTGRSITWDAAQHRCVGDDEANRLLRREYRQPWRYPEVQA